MIKMHTYILVGWIAVALVFLGPVNAAGQATDSAGDESSPPAPPKAKKSKAKKDSKQGFDNSRTDINLYNKTVLDKNRVKSIFYTEAEIKDVHLAVNTYLKNIGRGGDLTFDEEAFLSRLGGLKNSAKSQTGQSRYFTYPQFFLSTLVYYAPNDWVVWINNEKITPQTPRESSNIRVGGIASDRVTFEWFPLEMERVVEIWKSFPNDKVSVDIPRGQVVFSLKPNQTFSSYTMTVLEGKVLPVTVDVTKNIVPFTFEDQQAEEPKPEETDTIIEQDNVIQEEE